MKNEKEEIPEHNEIQEILCFMADGSELVIYEQYDAETDTWTQIRENGDKIIKNQRPR